MKILDYFFNALFVVGLALLCVCAGIQLEKWNERNVAKKEIRQELMAGNNQIENVNDGFEVLQQEAEDVRREMGRYWFREVHDDG